MSTPIVQLLPLTTCSADAPGWNYSPKNTCEDIPVDKPCFLTLWGYLTTQISTTLRQVEKYAIFDTNTINMYGNFYEPWQRHCRLVAFISAMLARRITDSDEEFAFYYGL